MKIGILGGTFDPIHRGHSYVARCVLRMFSLNHVLFMVSKLPPHKEKDDLTSPFHRYAMVVLDLLDDRDLYPSPWELERGTLSYTIETLQYFARRHPGDEYCFISGSDSLHEIHLWKDYGKLLREHCFIFVQRPGIEVDLDKLGVSASSRGTIRAVCEKERPTIRPGQSFLIAINAPAVSSTSIREMIVSGKQPSADMVSPAVLQYIRRHRLYEKGQSGS